MAVLRLVGLSLGAGLLPVVVGFASARPAPRYPAAAPPTSVSSRYVVTDVGPVLRVRNTVYVAGVSEIAPPTGSTVVISAANGQAEPVKARLAGGSVRAAIADGAGGWYIGGTFTSVGGVPRPGLAHLLADGTLDTAFAPPELGQVRALVLDAGRLYVGGVRALAAAPWFQPFLSALDPATGSALPISYPPLANNGGPPFGVIGLAAAGGRLYAAFNGTSGIAAYDEGSGALLWSQAGTPSDTYGGPAALALAGGRLLVGGQISTPAGAVDLEELDPATGAVVAQPAVGGPVSGIATVADTAYIVAGPGHRQSLWKLDLSSGTLTRRAPCQFCSAVSTDGTTLYAAKWAPVGGDLRVYTLDLDQAKPGLRTLSQVTVGGSVNALALQGGRLLLGGSFSGLGGVKRSGLAAFDARTGALLPWRPTVEGGVSALAHSGQTIYLGGDFSRVAGKRRDGLAAVSAIGKGKLLPWHPRLSSAEINSLAVAGRRVFAGGALVPYRTKPSAPGSSLSAFSARTGKQLAFKSKPLIHGVQTLAIWHRLLLVGGEHGVSALRTGGNGRTLWNQTVEGGNVPIVFALQTDGSTLYVGGRFTQVGGQARTNLAALALDRSGGLLDLAPQIPNQVMALARTDYGLVFSTMTLGPTWIGTQALGAVSPDGQVLPWQIAYPPSDVILSDRDSGGVLNVSVDHLAVVPGGLVAGGGFSWIGPADNPTPGALVWLR
jgi:outer membrane protein assembly factor BamB